MSVKVCCLSSLLCSITSVMSTLCSCVDCSLPGSSVHVIVPARILEGTAISSCSGSSWPRDWTHISCLAGRFFTAEPWGKPAFYYKKGFCFIDPFNYISVYYLFISVWTHGILHFPMCYNHLLWLNYPRLTSEVLLKLAFVLYWYLVPFFSTVLLSDRERCRGVKEYEKLPFGNC